MSDTKPIKFKPFDGTYSVSADGYCIRTDTGFFMRPVVSDSREPFYQFAINGKKRRVSLRLAVSTAYNKVMQFSDERATEMHHNADAWNAEERPTGKRKYNYEARRQWKKPKPELQLSPAEQMPCPWATLQLDYLPPGVASWDSAEMDPLSCGTAKVMIEIETKEARRKAA